MFTLIDTFLIKNSKVRIDKSKAKGCFLYNFKEGGFSKELLTRWLDGKLINIYEFDGHFGKIKKCPWCEISFNEEYEHLKEHKKTKKDMNTINLSKRAYPLLLSFLRSGNYDALLFLVNRSCQFCIDPLVEGREGKCAIPESARNKPRSLKILGLEFEGFNIEKYSDTSIAIVYKKRPV